MKNWHFILLFAVAFSLSPSDGFACGKKACKKETSETKKQKSCCGTGDHSKNGHSGCNGKCGHTSCVNPPAPSAISITPAAEFPVNRASTVSNKPRFHYAQPSVSSGYFTIWLIPKISLS